ncbi:MAG TPA: DUF6328 family protein [Actinophytocola sp.]|uniref:DUF6328 family protein n=1 Tax=Actinophytocola sp. TaxID=1872138 RepID=UPI002DDCE6AE|nr:DUF6328 family protein [Actinophytocola sp.]HEV2784152.1 DUF6328 family protein [Actinophytocola sp.]
MSRAEESQSQQLARNLNELLQEIRVAQAGVQILFGFLLSIAFTERYSTTSDYVRATHLVTVLFATASVALLTAPAAWHRVLFRLGRREKIINVADRLAVGGLASLALAMTGTVLLLGEMIIGGWPAVLLAILAGVGFGMLWFALPIRQRLRGPTPSRTD